MCNVDPIDGSVVVEAGLEGSLVEDGAVVGAGGVLDACQLGVFKLDEEA